MNNFWDFVKQNKWKILLVALGVLFVILVLTINFWRTLLIFAVLAVCYLFGMLLDEGGRERVIQFFSGIFHKNN